MSVRHRIDPCVALDPKYEYVDYNERNNLIQNAEDDK